MSAQPKLSIIIPCYNYEAYVGQAIESVLSQLTPEVEVIVVDDGSTDGSWAAIQRYRDQITALQLTNGGPIRACLAGMRLSRAPFIYFLDADDLLCPGALEALRPHLRPEVAKIQFMLAPIDQDGALIGPPFPELHEQASSDTLIRQIELRGCYATPPTSGNIYRRDLYEQLGDLSYEGGLGIDGVSYLLAPYVGEVVSISRPLGKYRIHNANLTGFANPTSDRMELAIRRFEGRLRHLKSLLQERGVGRSFAIKPAYAFVGELKMMISIAQGRRPQLRLLARYLRSVSAEQTGRRRIFDLSLAILLFTLPPKLSARIVNVRMNPSAGRRVRNALKTLVLARAR